MCYLELGLLTTLAGRYLDRPAPASPAHQEGLQCNPPTSGSGHPWWIRPPPEHNGRYLDRPAPASPAHQEGLPRPSPPLLMVALPGQTQIGGAAPRVRVGGCQSFKMKIASFEVSNEKVSSWKFDPQNTVHPPSCLPGCHCWVVVATALSMLLTSKTSRSPAEVPGGVTAGAGSAGANPNRGAAPRVRAGGGQSFKVEMTKCKVKYSKFQNENWKFRSFKRKRLQTEK